MIEHPHFGRDDNSVPPQLCREAAGRAQALRCAIDSIIDPGNIAHDIRRIKITGESLERMKRKSRCAAFGQRSKGFRREHPRRVADI